MELLLVRHALPVRQDPPPVDAPDAGRPADPALSTEGWAQAEALAAHWSGRVDAVWASPMRRARETAAPLAEAVGTEVVVDDDLAEMDRDADAYIPLEELRRDPAGWAEAVESWVGPGGADLRDAFRRRVGAAIERAVEANRGRRVAVVCHGGTINAALADVVGLEASLFFEPVYAGVSRVLASGSSGARQVVTVNEHWHIDGTVGPRLL